TTPESLYLLLTSARSREMLKTVRTVIVDEIHAVIGTRRGAHLALTLERLQQAIGADRPFLRLGLSATQRPVEGVARYLVSAPTRYRATSSTGRCVAERPSLRNGRSAPIACCSRSSVSARCAPRRVPITAWISSTITVRTVFNISRLRADVSSRYNDSGVV